MGRKRTWKRQHFLFFFACFPIMILWITACSHLPTTWQAGQNISHARSLMAKGNYKAALRETEKVLSSNPQTRGDDALYFMGIIYAHPQNPGSNLERSLESFQSLIKKYPQSDLVLEAEVWVSKLQKMRDMDEKILELKDQIDRLKEIDLGIEEKKRRKLPL